MRSHWSEPYLWIHLAGIAVFPVTLLLCLLALAIGVPVLPPWLEWLVIAAIGILPIAWMQWQRPFDIFSILVLTLKPEQLTPDQCRILEQMRAKNARVWTLSAALLAAGLLWLLYLLAPLVAGLLPLPEWRPLGLAAAALVFLMGNLFLQVPVSVLRILLLDSDRFQATAPYPLEQIRQSFTILGWPVEQIPLPFISGSLAAKTLTGVRVPSSRDASAAD